MTYKRKEVIGPHTLYLGDCLEVMPTLGRFDAVVTDPPYGISMSSNRQLGSSRLAKVTTYAKTDWDKTTADAAISQAITMVKWSVVFGGNYYDLPPTSCWLIWDKVNGESRFADCELAWTNLPKAVRRLKFLWNGFMRMERDVQRQHPTQKPVGVMKWCIEQLSTPNTTILDPFMGSGTTGVACQQLGRVFTGIELDPTYFDIACKRIEEAMRQPDLFVETPAKPEQLSIDLGAAE